MKDKKTVIGHKRRGKYGVKDIRMEGGCEEQIKRWRKETGS